MKTEVLIQMHGLLNKNLSDMGPSSSYGCGNCYQGLAGKIAVSIVFSGHPKRRRGDEGMRLL